MSPKIMQRFHRIIRNSGIKPKRVLEVGGVMDDGSLLRFPELASAEERYCLNLVEMPSDDDIKAVTGNANDMRGEFKDGMFDLVLCCSTLEHDKNFWLSVAEMKRVTAPKGLLIIGVPGYARRDDDEGRSTRTYRVHFDFDYYRFSEQAVREVFFDGMRKVRVAEVGTPPRLIGHGWKPAAPPPSIPRRAVRKARRALTRA